MIVHLGEKQLALDPELIDSLKKNFSSFCAIEKAFIVVVKAIIDHTKLNDGFSVE